VSESWSVLKFGGTSVAGKWQWERIATLVAERRSRGTRVLVVCSALNGVTDALEALADNPTTSGQIEPLIDRHKKLAADLDIDVSDLLDEARLRLHDVLKQLTESPGPAARAALLSQGEWLSSRLGCRYLATAMPIDWVDAREALRVEPEPDPAGKRAWLAACCGAGPEPDLVDRWTEKSPVLITQGFIAAAPDGRPALLGRGGSDTSAALLAGRLGAREVEIWTDVRGLYSADPRREPAARLIPALDYNEALEMAAGGARVIHGRSIRAAAAVGLQILIHKLAEPEAGGTRIGEPDPVAPPGLRAVTCQDDMIVLLLENLDTRQQIGFLAWVFEMIAAAGVSVDLVATSETTTTLAINRASNHLDRVAMESLQERLSERCNVRLYPDCACVNLVGRGARLALGLLDEAGGYFKANPLLMMSQSANDLSISLLVNASSAAELVSLLHRRLVAGA
jgi:diaminopimelate decarboxylase/aspartate kinase